MSVTLDQLGLRLPQAGWAVLDALRRHAFTGEARLIGSPAVRVYSDRGRIYLAEADGVAPLGPRLVVAGALTSAELERGVVRIGNDEHLGYLFERAPSVDRGEVMVAVEGITAAALQLIAGQTLAAVELSPYAFHPSGVHLWAQAPAEPAPPAPVMPVAPADLPVAQPTPPPAPAPTAAAETPVPETPVPILPPPAPAPGPFSTPPAGAPVTMPDPASGAHPHAADSAAAEPHPFDQFDDDVFSVIWPDGDVEEHPVEEALAAPASRLDDMVRLPDLPFDEFDALAVRRAVMADAPVGVDRPRPEPRLTGNGTNGNGKSNGNGRHVGHFDESLAAIRRRFRPGDAHA